MKINIINDNTYVIRTTFEFEDGYCFKQNIKNFESKEEAIKYMIDYCEMFEFVEREVHLC